MTNKIKKDKNAVLFTGTNIEGYKIKKTFTKSFNELLDYIKKHDDIDSVIVQEKSLTINKIIRLLSLNKKLVVIKPVEIDKTISGWERS